MYDTALCLRTLTWWRVCLPDDDPASLNGSDELNSGSSKVNLLLVLPLVLIVLQH